MSYAIYDNATGEIACMFDGPEEIAALQSESGQSFVSCDDGTADDTHYINTTTNKAVPRPATPCTPDKTEVTADGQDELKLSGLLADTEITISGAVNDSLTAEAGTLELTFSVPGEYQITALSPFPHKPTEVTINAS